MIILTGVSGFIGSCLLTKLNASGFNRDVVVVDDFYKLYKDKNTDEKVVREWMHRDIFLDWFEKTTQKVDFVLHMGARTDTTLMDVEIFNELNLNYSKRIWNVCTKRGIPLIYASSAATYGDGSQGFNDDHAVIHNLVPLNPYGDSKHQFDLWALEQKDKPPFWIGCKFFNVYGPNEYHKGRMASVIFHTFHQIKNTGGMKLFRSHRPDFKDGHQSRDFIYVKDILNMILYFMNNQHVDSDIYNFGTGKARTFLDLAKSTFTAMNVPENISYIDTPVDIRDAYQYFTEADMTKVRAAGYTQEFTTLEDGVNEYVNEYLKKGKYF
ncbi:MAG: ADP-glyceromanno-heptose 6-epimerase [Saprospiraceae bacterium]|jgi:ADP-L-glycero-D-manno-heptose 6-epimerase|nr:ADP-glyceromanno-heptose 6-epimerase [Saprospiraceae bacterium]MBP6566370.1 ADP-glyceromanno-heptose 6-epimerase [Saprospiraceae bacterium]